MANGDAMRRVWPVGAWVGAAIAPGTCREQGEDGAAAAAAVAASHPRAALLIE